MRIWRLSVHPTFDGEGARRVGGRWNEPGLAVIYASGALSLAVLEFLVHVDRDTAPPELVAHYAEVPDDLRIAQVEASELPADWRTAPAPAALRELGSRWLREGRTLVLSVPTAVLGVPVHLLPAERNYLLNPGHPDFARVRARRERFHFDERLWRFG